LEVQRDVLCDLAAQYLALAEKQRATIPLMVGHRLVGSSSLHTGDFVDSRAHFNQALSLYDADKHRSLATRFGQDIRVSILSFRSITLWMLGYPEAALTDVDQVVKDAREIGHAPSLIYALAVTSVPQLLVGNYASANAQTDEAVAMAEEKSVMFWKAMGAIVQGCVLAATGKASDAVHQITSGLTAAYRSTGATVWLPKGLRVYCASFGYLRTITAGAERVDLDGNPAGVVTAEAAALALALLAARGDKEKRRQDEKERQGSKQKPARTPPQPKRITLADLRKAAEKRRPPP
jgi:tetratricopeptide (TPR) repeat protein